MKLENSKTRVVLEGKKEEGWRQDPLLKQSHRTQVIIGNVGKIESKMVPRTETRKGEGDLEQEEDMSLGSEGRVREYF